MKGLDELLVKREEMAAIKAALKTKKGMIIWEEALQDLRRTSGDWKHVARIARHVRARLEAEGLI